MTRQRADVEATVRAWLDEGVTAIPDRLIDSVLGELSSTPQRGNRRARIGGLRVSTPAVLAVAAVVLAFTIGVALLLRPQVGDHFAPEWHVLPTQETDPLEPGAYLIDDPFPVRIGITVPDGWGTGGTRSTLAQVGTGGGGLSFTLVEGVYADPCHLEAGLIDPKVGPTADDLASALAGLPGVGASVPTDVVIDGHRAVTLTLNAPSSVASCTEPDGGPKFRIWGAPEWHWLDPDERNRLWIVEVAGTRLVIVAAEFPDTPPRVLADLNAMIASIDLDPSGVTIVPDGSPTSTPSLRPLPSSGPLAPADYTFSVRLHRYTESGTAVPLASRNRGIVTVPTGWSARGTGIVKDTPGGPAVSVGTVARVYIDPVTGRRRDTDSQIRRSCARWAAWRMLSPCGGCPMRRSSPATSLRRSLRPRRSRSTCPGTASSAATCS